MKIAGLGFVFVALAIAACGGDDDAGSGGAGGKGDNGESGASGGSSDKTMICGAKTCRLSADSLDAPCCRDEFAGECGLMVGNQCRKLRAKIDERCPLPEIPGIADAADPANERNGVSGCCTDNNECGLDLGLGTGCSGNASNCMFFPPPYTDSLALTTCEGEPLQNIPDACKTGAAGSE
ncbi:MAG TPA: hypothetical protein VFG30_07965 [Polyangiales bacterium]|nr:hypothetical protein [Polyangiales bacterium]